MWKRIDMQIPLETFAQRAWYAYQCLPRDERGRPPTLGEVVGNERRSMLSKFFKGHRSDPRQDTRVWMAEALKVPRAWLDYGEGVPPKLTGPYRRMPIDKSVKEEDPEEWVKKYEAIGGVPKGIPNNFQIAVLFFRERLDTRVMAEVAREAHGQEDTKTPEEWGRRLRTAQVRITGDWNLGPPEMESPVEHTASQAKESNVPAKKRRAG